MTLGRVQRKLLDYGDVRGLVFVAFCEVTEGVHELVHHLADSRLKAEGSQQGRESARGRWGSNWEYGRRSTPASVHGA